MYKTAKGSDLEKVSMSAKLLQEMASSTEVVGTEQIGVDILFSKTFHASMNSLLKDLFCFCFLIKMFL